MAQGVVSREHEQGPRDYQEDRFFSAAVPSSEPGGWLMAVMDGHGGSMASNVCAEEIGGLFEQCFGEGSPESILRALVQKLVEMTRQFREGSTLSIAWVREDHDEVSVAVLGDSPVIVVDQLGQVHVSPEHNVRTNLAERNAMVARGGSYRNGYVYNQLDVGFQVSRALGDGDLDRILSREPEIYTIKNPRWVVVASDGVLDPGHGNTTPLVQKLVGLLKSGLKASEIMSWAKDRNLKDNATVIVWQHKNALSKDV